MIDQLIVFMRSSLSASRSEMRSLETEFEQLRAYLELMKVRMAERLQFELELPAALKDVELPAMLIQPLLENAIKHGLEPSLARWLFDGTCQQAQSPTSCEIEVLDTGLGLEEAHPEGLWPDSHHRTAAGTCIGEQGSVSDRAGRQAVAPVAWSACPDKSQTGGSTMNRIRAIIAEDEPLLAAGSGAACCIRSGPSSRLPLSPATATKQSAKRLAELPEHAVS